MMNYFDNTATPGAPYVIGSLIVCLAIATTYRIPTEAEYFAYLENLESDDDQREGLLSEMRREEEERAKLQATAMKLTSAPMRFAKA